MRSRFNEKPHLQRKDRVQWRKTFSIDFWPLTNSPPPSLSPSLSLPFFVFTPPHTHSFSASLSFSLPFSAPLLSFSPSPQPLPHYTEPSSFFIEYWLSVNPISYIILARNRQTFLRGSLRTCRFLFVFNLKPEYSGQSLSLDLAIQNSGQ